MMMGLEATGSGGCVCVICTCSSVSFFWRICRTPRRSVRGRFFVFVDNFCCGSGAGKIREEARSRTRLNARGQHVLIFFLAVGCRSWVYVMIHMIYTKYARKYRQTSSSYSTVYALRTNCTFATGWYYFFFLSFSLCSFFSLSFFFFYFMPLAELRRRSGVLTLCWSDSRTYWPGSTDKTEPS